MGRSYRWVYRRSSIWLTLVVCLIFVGAPAAHGQTDVRYFTETGHYLRGAFRFFWESNGAIGVFGFPITEEYVRASDGKVVQYFERARFELSQQGNQASIDLGKLGVEITNNQSFPKATPITNTPNRRYFPQTQHIVQYGFKTIWEGSGGERIFGLPISEELEEVIDDGQLHTVQYFERARFEFWPQYAPGRRVLISALGRKLAPPQLVTPLPPNAPPASPIPEGNTPAPAPAPPASPAAPAIPASVNAKVTPESGAPGTTFALDAYGFNPGEKVGVWLTAPNQATVGANFQAKADSKGSIAGDKIGITTNENFSDGIWSFNAQGVSSKKQAIGYFLIVRSGAGGGSNGAAGNPNNLGIPLHDQLPIQGQALIVPIAGPVGTSFAFLGQGFDPNEQVSSWISTPDKRATPLSDDEIDKQGAAVQVQFGTDGLSNGTYTVVVQGKKTGTIAAANFKLTNDYVAPPGTQRPDSVNGSATPVEGGQSVTFQLRGQGLQANEQVQTWSTSPEGIYVLLPEDSVADSQGRIGYQPPLDLRGSDETNPGIYGFHFRGRSSGARIDIYLTYVP